MYAWVGCGGGGDACLVVVVVVVVVVGVSRHSDTRSVNATGWLNACLWVRGRTGLNRNRESLQNLKGVGRNPLVATKNGNKVWERLPTDK